MTVEQKAKAYDKALEKAKIWQEHLYDVNDKDYADELNYIFPELSESEDEKIRKDILCYFEHYAHDIKGADLQKWVAWLEKQGENNKSLYIRFGDIPKNEKSKVYNGEIEIGTEKGVSVYPAFEDSEGNIVLGLSLPITKTSLYTQQHLLEYDNRPCYLVSGDYVGKGTDGEPLLRNIKIIREIKDFRVNQSEQKPILDIEIPFGAKDSELQEATYYIPKGFYAEIDNDKVVIKKGEKPTAWSEENGRRIQRISDFIWKNRKGDTDDIYQQEQDVKWLKSLKDRVGCEANCTTTKEWSEEDEHRVKDTIYFLDTAKKHYASAVELDACIDWLKSLEDRVQPKQEWSAEDNSVLKDIKVAVASYWDEDTENIILDWLKTFKQRIGG